MQNTSGRKGRSIKNKWTNPLVGNDWKDGLKMHLE